jgi:hypothetical protein
MKCYKSCVSAGVGVASLQRAVLLLQHMAAAALTKRLNSSTAKVQAIAHACI